jgi:BirA family transcriptional regulator, biotin operon repressor / biotin---[acetyl-CoA-carboxylase] ligase
MTGIVARDALRNVQLVRRIYFFPVISSTMDWANALLVRANGSPDLSGTLVITDYQTRGRGRFGRPWIAPQGTSLLFTLILHVCECGADLSDTELPEAHSITRFLPMAVPVSIRNAIQTVTGLNARIKYPNDVLIDGKKVAGVLLQSVQVKSHAFVLVGIGINISNTTDQLPPVNHIAPTSLYLETCEMVDDSRVLNCVLTELQRILWAPSEVIWQMNLHCDTIGMHVEVNTSHGILKGLVVGVTNDGALIVRRPSGLQEVLHSGDIIQVSRV